MKVINENANYNSFSLEALRKRVASGLHGLHGRVRVKKPLLKKAHLKMRETFCEKYKDWTYDDWKKVLWSDKTKICLCGSDGKRYTRKRENQKLSRDSLTTSK